MTGPGGVLANAVAGATYGYDLIWAAALALLFRFVWVNTATRYALVSGESLLQGYARMGRWLVWVIFLSAFLVRHASSLYTILLMGSAAHLLLPLPFPSSAAIWTVAFTLLGFAMMFWRGYPVMERVCKVMVGAMGFSLVVAALLAKPRPIDILRGVFIPIVPQSDGLYSAILLLTAMVGSQVGSLSNLSYAYLVTEKGWRGVENLARQRFDLLTGFGIRLSVAALVQIAAAGVLLPMGVRPRALEDIVKIFTETEGALGGAIFTLGLWAICFSNYVGGTVSYGLIMQDILRRFTARFRGEMDTAPDQARRDPVYRWSIALLGLSPLYIVFTQAEAVSLAITVRALTVIVVPVLGLALLKMTNDRARMGEHRNRWPTNLLMAMMVLVSAYLTVRNGLELWVRYAPN